MVEMSETDAVAKVALLQLDEGLLRSSSNDEKRDRPTIEVSTNLKEMTDQALECLKAEDNLYQRGREIVHVLAADQSGMAPPVQREVGTPVIAGVKQARLTELMSVHATWMRHNAKGKVVETLPPDRVAQTVMARPSWPLRTLIAVVETPTIRPDGSVLEESGFDSATGLLLRPPKGVAFPKVPRYPTRDDAAKALELLREPLVDFPWEQPHHKDAALAAMVTPVVRHAIDGPCPMFLFDATTPGSGKGLLADVVGIIATGRKCNKMPPADNEAEERKRITAVAKEGDQVICIDNALRIGSPALDAALTTTTWKDRILGVSDNVQLPMRTVWLATGNNVVLVGDMLRRVVPCKLAPATENPEERTGFQHTNLLRWVSENRPALVTAALTLVRAYFVAGKPSQNLTPMGTFESWSEVVRDALVWAGAGDCNLARRDMQAEATPELDSLKALLKAWHDAFKDDPKTLRNAVACDAHGDHMFPVLAAAIAELAPAKNGAVDIEQVGKLFRDKKGRVFGGLRVESAGKTATGRAWRVAKVAAAQ